MSSKKQLPTQKQLEEAVAQALARLGGIATNDDIRAEVARELNLSDELLAIRHGNGKRSELEYRLAWARTRLKEAGRIERASYRAWSLARLVSEQEGA